MRGRALLIVLCIALALIPYYYLNRWLLKVIRPRDGAARFCLYMIANFVGVIVYTVLLVGVVTKLFPLH